VKNAFALDLKDAGDDPADAVTNALTELQKTMGDRLTAVEIKSQAETDRVTKIEARLQRAANDNYANDNDKDIERKALGSFARSGGSDDLSKFARTADVEFKGLTVGNDVGAGYLALPTIESGIRTLLCDASPLRALASAVTISGTSYDIILDDSDVDCGWVNEVQERPETSGPSLRALSIPVHELYAAPKASQQLLDDANIDLGAWLEGKIADRFVRVEGSAFATGDGVGKPRGFLAYGTQATADFTREFGKFQHIAALSTTPTDEQLADAIVRLSLTLRTPYRTNATFLMSREAAVRVRQIKDSNKHYIWQPGLQDGSPDRLCGFPVICDDNMEAIGSGTYPVALADWKQAYQIVDRHGMRVLRDPYSAKPHTIFYTYRRVGGGAVDFNALKLLKIAAS
jgi:HK97 family phage major capsid protein